MLHWPTSRPIPIARLTCPARFWVMSTSTVSPTHKAEKAFHNRYFVIAHRLCTQRRHRDYCFVCVWWLHMISVINRITFAFPSRYTRLLQYYYITRYIDRPKVSLDLKYRHIMTCLSSCAKHTTTTNKLRFVSCYFLTHTGTTTNRFRTMPSCSATRILQPR